MTTNRGPWRAFTGAAILAAILLSPVTGAHAIENEDKPYVIKDGVVDWYTFSGFRRYHSECHVCHGPDGLGSSFAPGLIETMKNSTYDDFIEIVVNGREAVGTAKQNKMPAFGTNQNVFCFMDDIYTYLKARSDGVLVRGRPSKKQAKPDEAKERDNDCME